MQFDHSNLTKAQSRLIPVLLIIITAILSIRALQVARPVLMPVAIAFFIAVLVNPLQTWLEDRLPRWLSLGIILLVIAVILSIFAGMIELSLELIEPKVPEYTEQAQQFIEFGRTWLRDHGLPTGQGSQGNAALSEAFQQALGGAKTVLGAVSLFILIVAFLSLLLLEVAKYRERTLRAFPDSAGESIVHAVSNMGQKLRRYFLVVAFTSFLTGILTALWCYILGVDLALVWGLLAFVLNFIPTLGSIVATAIPAIVATIFQGPAIGAATLVGLGVIQNILGNFVDPKLQGKYLQLSPTVSLFSTVFWGWVWGIPGAFIGVPMTAAIVLLANEFKASRPISVMLGNQD